MPDPVNKYVLLFVYVLLVYLLGSPFFRTLCNPKKLLFYWVDSISILSG